MNDPQPTSTQPELNQGNILIVDDTPDNLRVLSQLLNRQGYEVRAVTTGKMALTVVKAAPPELILLDIRMPQMDGYEVCQSLKDSPLTKEIPVIFISASDEISDKVQAFNMGGVDYITKPFQMAEVLARVATHLTLRRLQQTLSAQNAQLEQEVQDRKQAELKYRSIFENCLEGIFQASLNGQYLSVNPALAAIYGYDSPDDLVKAVNEDGKVLYVRPGRRDELLVYLTQFGKVSNFESEVYHHDGSTIWIAENVRVVNDDNNKPLYYEGTVQDITDRRDMEAQLRQQRQEADRLLLSILPPLIAERLKRNQSTIADQFSDVTVLFAEVINFTPLAQRMAPIELIDLLNQIFSAFDQLASEYGVEKIKTVGTEYIAASGLPNPRPFHAEAIADMALAMRDVVTQFQADQENPFQVRIGINTGSVIAGVIGKHKFTYDLWGDTVNLASQLEHQGMPGQIQVSSETYKRLKHRYIFEERGMINVQETGDINTYWLIGASQE